MNLAKRLRNVVDLAIPKLENLRETDSKPDPETWSKREILGHLVDSAANNHQRFVRAQYQENLIFPGYEQDIWVRVQKYQTREWSEILDMWKRYNLHLALVIENISDIDLFKKVSEHNFHEIAWHPVPEGSETNLAYFIADYIDHMEHHLNQISDS